MGDKKVDAGGGKSGKPDKLWGGRFSEATDKFIERFTASVGFYARLYKQDIAGSIAHATMLAEAGVLTEPGPPARPGRRGGRAPPAAGPATAT